ncbi:MAG: peptidylprolyl isomerase, partial [Nitrospinae bacterium]|nr:peptidylprolyl isomerase [Nitrospinota bacterium]
MAVSQAARRRFYHGKPPEEEVAALRREAGGALVDRFLIVREAKRRGVEPDWKSIETQLAQYEKQYANSESWRARRETMLPQLREQLTELGLLARMEQEIRAAAAEPPDEMARAYYQSNLDKFTEPEQLRLSLILLMVDPSSPREVWDSAAAEAEGYLARLRAGEDFAQIARRHSEDETAAQGGDLGLVHTISLPPAIQEAVKDLAPGGLSAITRTLHGMAIVRLEERRAPYLHTFDEVAARARGLAGREWFDRLWEDFRAKLRAQAV